jgi:site-specific DNA-methyltransferase (adenine-specific)
MDVFNENLSIEYLEVDKLQPYERNAKKHDVDDVQAIIRSIESFGFSDPIGIWGPDNTIVEGHGRLEAAKKLGLEKVPVIRLDHMNDEQRRAYALAHNKTAELSGWLDEILKEELDSITDFDMGDFGFDPEEIEVNPEEIEEDDFDVEEAIPEEPKAKLGDIYRLGNHRLICGDSTDSATIDSSAETVPTRQP